MAKQKATHYGECQCCGSRQKLPSGKLSLHGYTVNKSHGYAFFNGVCEGANELPFEQSTGLIETFIRRATKNRDWLTAKVAELRQPATDDTKVWLHLYEKGNYSVRGYYYWSEVTLTMTAEKVEGMGDDYTRCTFFYDNAKGERVEVRNDYNYGYPKSIAEFATNANATYARSLEKQIAQAQGYINWQSKRVNEWTEQPLTPIK
jgi:hypothetical protein